MSLVVKGHSASDSDKPPNYGTVEDPEVIFKDRTTRSDRPDEYYHLSPTIKLIQTHKIKRFCNIMKRNTHMHDRQDCETVPLIVRVIF